MDAKNCVESLKVDATCSLCLCYFVDPVIIKCGHTFCKKCLLSFCKKLYISKACPICRTTIASEDILCNRKLRNLVKISKILRPYLLQSIRDLPICDKHGKEQTLFCEEDHKPLCGPCFLTTDHKEHKVLPLEVAVSQYMEKLEATCNTLRSKKEKIQMELTFEKVRAAQWEEEGHVLKDLVMCEYEKMHQFFWEEEQVKLQTLDKEIRDLKNKEGLSQKSIKVQKQFVKSEFEKKQQILSEEIKLHLRTLDQELKANLSKIEESKTKLKQKIHNLEMVISEIEKNYDKPPIEMLQDAKGSLERNMDLFPQHSKKIASLRWTRHPISGMIEMLLTFHRHVCLDPKITNPHLVLYEDFYSVEYNSIPQDTHDNQDFVFCVLANQTFTSGKHYWEVVVGNKRKWEVGICKLSIRRKGSQKFHGDKFTLVAFVCDNAFQLRCSNQNVPSCQPFRKVGIFLDYERGHIAFYNTIDRTLIYSLSNKIFQGPLYPYFSPWFPNGEKHPSTST